MAATTALSPDQAFQIAKRIQGTQTILLRGLDHLAHEEDGERAAAAIVENVTKKELVEGIA